jgi:hypothetical protein
MVGLGVARQHLEALAGESGVARRQGAARRDDLEPQAHGGGSGEAIGAAQLYPCLRVRLWHLPELLDRRLWQDHGSDPVGELRAGGFRSERLAGSPAQKLFIQARFGLLRWERRPGRGAGSVKNFV